MRHERGWREKIAARTARRLQANLRRAAEAEGRSSMVWSPKENDAFFGEPQEDAREPGAHADDAETMCVWCETRVRCACKSHYDTLTCTHRVIVPTAEEWDSSVEARAAELHEGCRMPMEQARELAESEAKPTPNLELFAAFGAADAAKEQDLRGYYPMAARVLAEEVRSLKAQLAKFTPLRAKGVVDADDNLDCWDTNPYEICTRHVAALNEKDPAAMWRVVDLYAVDLRPNAKLTGPRENHGDTDENH